MKHTIALFVLLLLMLLAAIHAADTKPNIVLILADDKYEEKPWTTHFAGRNGRFLAKMADPKLPWTRGQLRRVQLN